MSQLQKTAKMIWMIKGHVPVSLHQASMEELQSTYDSYFKRLWGNHEAVYREEGFEEAWDVFVKQRQH